MSRKKWLHKFSVTYCGASSGAEALRHRRGRRWQRTHLVDRMAVEPTLGACKYLAIDGSHKVEGADARPTVGQHGARQKRVAQDDAAPVVDQQDAQLERL